MATDRDTILAINTGSSSVRAAVYAPSGLRRIADCRIALTGQAASDALPQLLQQLRTPSPGVVAHRVVHGGPALRAPCPIDAAVEAEIARWSMLAPLHNPVALDWIGAIRERFGAPLPQVAVFDTGFFRQLPAEAAAYALPAALTQQYGIRRYGFHGLAHRSMLEWWRDHQRPGRAAARVISLQLGSGCSITASRDGLAVDTSMGFSPLEGLVMATRSGDLDPGIVLHLLKSGEVSVTELEEMLNDRAGLLGLSGISGDMRDLLASEEPAAQLAVAVYCQRARKYVGAYLALLGGADAILFGGGVGEHVPEVRSRVLAGLEFAGIRVDAARNAAVGTAGGIISTADSPTAIWVASVDEERILAQEALAWWPRQTPATQRTHTVREK